MQRSLSLFVLLLLVAAGAAQAGLTFTSTTTAVGARGAEMQNSTVRAQIDGEKARLEFSASQNPMMPPGAYLLTQNAGGEFLLVNPKEKTYAKFDLAAMMGAAGGMMKAMGGLVKMNVSDPKVEKLLDEDGEKVAGLSTRHYRFRTAYTMEIVIFGRANKTSTLTEEDIWATQDIAADLTGAWRNWSANKVGFPALDKLIEAEKAKIVGLPLRRIVTTTQTDAQGKQTTTKTTAEVTDLDLHANIPASAFTVPSGYEETDLMGGMGMPPSE